MLYQIFSYLNYYLKAKTVYNIHSPFVYDFILNVMDTDKEYYCYNALENIRKALLRNETEIDFVDYGAGNHQGPRKVSEIAGSSLSSKAQCRLLFNLISSYKPKTVLEFGTSLGLSTMYMAKAIGHGSIYTMEGNPDSLLIASEIFGQYHTENINAYQGNFDSILESILERIKKIDMVFLDGNHRGQSTSDYFEKCKPYLSDDAIIVVDDIYWSPDMKGAWKRIIKDNDVSISIDLFDMGIVFLNQKFSKEHHVLIDYWKKPWKLGIFG